MSKAKKDIRPLSLNGLRFSDIRGNFVVSEDHFITFRDKETLERYINQRHRYWKGLLKMELQFMPDSSETLAEIEVYKVLKLVSAKLGVPIERAISSSKHDAVEVRRLTIKICTERKVRVGTIAKGLGIAHDLVVYHKKQFNNYIETDQAYKEKYIEIEDFVFSTMYGRFIEDGSGKTNKINNSENEQ